MPGTTAVSASLHTPNWGPRCHRGPKLQSLSPETKFQPPKFKYETLEISKVFVSLTPYPFLSYNL